MDAMALTDHGVLYGAIEFYETAKDKGIKPIIGVEAYVAPRSRRDKSTAEDGNPCHLILLAADNTGYQNLLALITEAHLNGFYYKPRIDWELLAKHHQGLICTSACLQGEVAQSILRGDEAGAKTAVERHASLFGDRYYLELQHHPNIPEQGRANEAVKRLAKETGVPLVATNDSHYVLPDDAEPQDVLLCIQTSKLIDDTNRLNMTGEDFSLKSPQQMAEAFADTPEAVTNTVTIAERCNVELELGKMILPKFETPNDSSQTNYLRKLVREGITKRYGTAPRQEVTQRVDYEMGVIEKMGYESYFLIVSDFVNYAKNQGIMVGPGRGSAASSIVLYALRVTDLDPLKHGLLFERFLNPDRISMPDIDMDFADDRRGEVIEYIGQKYGHDHVAQIITFGTMAARAAVRDTGRVLGMPYADVDRVAKLIPFGMTLAEAKRSAELRSLYESDAQVKRLLDLAERLEGVVRHASTHAAGVVIGDAPLVNYVPLQRATKGDETVITQYEMNAIERVGLLKMDILGLANLTILRNATEIIEAIEGVNVNLDNLPLDDQETFALLSRGQTHGIFQLESEGMRRYIKELKPTSFDDIIAMVSLYRPGPMQWIDSFIRRKHGKEDITYVHPKVANALKETYGVIVYQEQVMQIARELAGFSGPEADTLRKAMGKKIAKLLVQMKEQFIDGAVKQGVDRGLATKLFGELEDFSRYAFNKCHAAPYAYIAYQTAYLKAHYPKPFMAALMTSEQENLDKLTAAIAECEQLGINVLPPDVNESYADFAVTPDKQSIRFGLKAIKNVGRNTVSALVQTRKADGPFRDLSDFLTRLPEGTANRKSLESLMKAGALDSLADRGQMLAGLEAIIRFAQARSAESRRGQHSLFGEELMPPSPLRLPPSGEVDRRQKLDWERELLGMYVSEHPLAAHQERLKEFTPLGAIAGMPNGRTTTVAGLVANAKRINTRNGDPMAFVTLEDTHSQVEVIVFPKLYQGHQALLAPGTLLTVAGKVSHKDNEVKLLVDALEALDGAAASQSENSKPAVVEDVDIEDLDAPSELVASSPAVDNQAGPSYDTLTIRLSPATTLQTLEEMKQVLSAHRGESPVYLVIPRGDEEKRVKLPHGVRHSESLITALASVDRDVAVQLG